MTDDFSQLKQWIEHMAALIENNADPEPHYINSFLQEPQLATQLIDLLNQLTESQLEETRSYYSACIYALDICVAQLQTALEGGSKGAAKILHHLMSYLAQTISSGSHSLSFWLPILNAFYDVHAELSDELRDAYLELAGQEEEIPPEEEVNHLKAIQDMINELSELSIFDIAENFFAQSYAMPVEFFADLVFDLYSIPEGQDIALLMLLHPKPFVREIVIAAHEEIVNQVTFSSASLTRLQAIKNWYPAQYHEQFNRWIKLQRKKGVILNPPPHGEIKRIKASEVDGSGAQGLFIHVKLGRSNRLCGLLFKDEIGIKDVWVTPIMTTAEINRYYEEAFDDSVTLRVVDMDYYRVVCQHFLAMTLARNEVPDLHFLEMQELLGLHFTPEAIDIAGVIEELGVQINPFTPEIVAASFKRSKSWLKNKSFTESWYIENSHVDKLVNRCSSFVEGIKVCAIDEATEAVFSLEFEARRQKWLFHFLWITLWLKASGRPNERLWQDSFFIAHAIFTGTALKEIPVMQEIVRQTIYNSIETMNERRTHLNQE
ncbi:hypothetical protein Lbir_1815 [Legionella birminghamensis]|uniref:Uncharacterized protein n=1 Tax=Legionella birminghamensis TaxID=28083 RepID=A0A378I6H1_9GAMM|nr:hypothetical protein [Legionella birminghamensis]KTC70232.1 hypothetical protein Lbir_1815 [Legionella birminghamensis]STX30360.1 Uncharacterised protein [Legionella birminghamensis]